MQALSYLGVLSSKSTRVKTAIAQQYCAKALFELPTETVSFFIPQLWFLPKYLLNFSLSYLFYSLLSIHSSSPYIDYLLLSLASRSLHVGLTIYLQLNSFEEDQRSLPVCFTSIADQLSNISTLCSTAWAVSHDWTSEFLICYREVCIWSASWAWAIIYFSVITITSYKPSQSLRGLVQPVIYNYSFQNIS